MIFTNCTYVIQCNECETQNKLTYRNPGKDKLYEFISEMRKLGWDCDDLAANDLCPKCKNN